MVTSPIITAASLDSYLAEGSKLDLKIVDCRFALGDPDLGRQQYETAHIPEAYYLDLNRDLSSPAGVHGGRHPLPDDRVLGDKLAAMGINSDTLVVAYDDSRFAFAARFWWLLRYYGHQRVALLDGGYRNWIEAGYAVTANLPETSVRGNFQPQIQSEWIVDIDRVKAIQHSPAHRLIDSREPDRYLGNTEPIDPIAGHIPSAVNYPWQDVSTPEGFVLPVQEQQQRWTAISPDIEPIVYCGSGVTACVNLLSLNLAGIDGAKLYPGSWSDWCSY
ncbi:sulfurtransferase [Chamaesiphon sp. VAR_48_metabat_135_sub]|uniref:sulfurtransferase n=1 Tax=Chamaesiphon sp. VAR_48_metabat_135_sub TaxID=2964699 RepID=UPI00286CDB84|nr:sulfurtransferase [Chamaesiphon sp. VAR_48_metabat_135_sub]